MSTVSITVISGWISLEKTLIDFISIQTLNYNLQCMQSNNLLITCVKTIDFLFILIFTHIMPKKAVLFTEMQLMISLSRSKAKFFANYLP